MESLSAEHTAIPAENPMEAPDDAAPMDENDIPDAEAIASPAENLPTASVPMLQAPGTTPPPPSSSAAADEKTPMPKISKDQALTDTLKQDKTPGTAQNVIPLPKVEGTWVDKLATTNPLSILGEGKAKTSAAGTVQGNGDSLESLVESARRPSAGNSRSNASVFDISGVMLRMSLRQVDETMQNRGFRKIMQNIRFPILSNGVTKKAAATAVSSAMSVLRPVSWRGPKSQTTVRPAGKICQVRHQRGNSGYLYQ